MNKLCDLFLLRKLSWRDSIEGASDLNLFFHLFIFIDLVHFMVLLEGPLESLLES
jgi:hypothetical protein